MIGGRVVSWISWLESRRGLLCLFGLGLAIRLVLARYSVGLMFDLSVFRQWSDRLVELGPLQFYRPGDLNDYPPGYLYVLLALGKVSHALRGTAPSVAALKLPGILADLGVAVLAMLLAARMAPVSLAPRIPVRAMAAGAILLNPAVILISAMWGQVDSVLGLLVLASIYALAGPPTLAREACAVALLALAICTKPQAVFAVPVLLVVLAQRHLRGGAPVRGWPAIAGRLGVLVVVAATVVVALFAPFGLGPSDIPRFYRDGGSVYPFTSLWAFNVWGIAGFYRPDVGTSALTFGGITAFHLGLVAFTVSTIALAGRSWQSAARRVDADAVVLFGAVAATCTGFALLTRMHERYLYLAIVGLAPFVGTRSFRWALVILSMCFFLNVHFVYVFYSQHAFPPTGAWTIQPVFNLLFGRERNAFELKALSTITTTACLTVAFLGWRWLEPRTAPSQSAVQMS